MKIKKNNTINNRFFQIILIIDYTWRKTFQPILATKIDLIARWQHFFVIVMGTLQGATFKPKKSLP